MKRKITCRKEFHDAASNWNQNRLDDLGEFNRARYAKGRNSSW